ncbi:MAG: hypothetical protein N2663_09000 [Chlorobi bacterium]|nr:hypothetical protein [Chlorobiota bacterium]
MDEMTSEQLNIVPSLAIPINQPLFEQEGVRSVAVRSLLRIEQTSLSSEHVVSAEIAAHPEWTEFDRALYQELVFGTLRWRAKLDWILTGFYHGEFSKCMPVIQETLRVALYQILMISKVSPQIAIESAGRIIERTRDTEYASRLVGVLRGIARNVAGIRYPPQEQLPLYMHVVYSHPLWLVQRWIERYGEEIAQQMLAANLERPPVFLASNSLRASLDTLIAELQQMAIPLETIPTNPPLLRINPFADYTHFDVWQRGMCYTSDPIWSAAAAVIAQYTEGDVLYACTNLSRTLLPFIELTQKANRLLTLHTSLPVLPGWLHRECTRLGWQLPPLLTDLSPESVSTIVIETPSSGIGLWRRQPERKWRSDSIDIHRSTRRALELIEQVLPSLKTGGHVLLLTLSTEQEETDSLVEWMCVRQGGFRRVPLEMDAFTSAFRRNNGSLLSLPHLHRGDTVYVSLVEKH